MRKCIGLGFERLSFVLMLTLGVILYIIYYTIILYIYIYYYILYIIYYIIYYILYYYILYYYILYYLILYSSIFYSSHLPFLFRSSLLFLSSLLLFYSLPPLPHPLLSPPLLSSVHSIRVGTYIYLFILYSSFLIQLLTPHVLSEWMVEVCAGD